MLESTAETDIKNGSIVGVNSNICTVLSTQEQFQQPLQAIFNAKRDYKQGETVLFEAPGLPELIRNECDNIKKLRAVGEKAGQPQKKNIEGLLLLKINSIKQGLTCSKKMQSQ